MAPPPAAAPLNTDLYSDLDQSSTDGQTDNSIAGKPRYAPGEGPGVTAVQCAELGARERGCLGCVFDTTIL